MSAWRQRFKGSGWPGRLASWVGRLSDAVPLDLGALNGIAGIRAAFACALPVVYGELAHAPQFSWIAIAAFWGCLCDSGGAWRERLVSMLAFTILGSLGTFIAVLLHDSAPAAIAFILAWCFVCSLVRVFGNAASVVGIILNVAVLVTLGIPASGLDLALQLAQLTALGSGWAMLLALGLWRLQPYGPAQKALARCWRELADYARTLSRLHRGPQRDPDSWHEATANCKRALRDAIEAAQGVVVATRRTRAGVSGTGQMLLALLSDLDQGYAALIGVNEVLEGAYPLVWAGEGGAGIRRAVHVALGRLARRAEAIAVALEGGHPQRVRAADGLIQALHDRIRQDGRPSHHAYVVDLLREVSRWIDAAFETMGAPSTVAQRARPQQERPALRAQVLSWLATLRANLSFGSVAFRHALRLAVTAAVAVLVTDLLDISRGYWISVTAISVLQPYQAETWRRTFDRIAGSVLGGLIGALLIQRVGAPTELAFLLFPLSLLAFSLRSVNYAVFILCITPLVVVIAELFRPAGIGDAHLASLRAIDSVLGGAIGLVASFLLWPTWQKSQMRSHMAAAVRAHRDYFLVVAGGRLGANSADIALARRQAGLASNNAEASLQRAFSEAPLRSRNQTEPVLVVLASLRRMGGAITTLGFLPQLASANGDAERFRAAREWISASMSALADALEQRCAPPALPAPPPLPAAMSDDVREAILANEFACVARQLSVLHEAAGRRSRFAGRLREERRSRARSG